jgi:multiple sugar transport system substrate-binding protein
MKKITAFFLIILTILSVASCTGKNTPSKNNSSKSSANTSETGLTSDSNADSTGSGTGSGTGSTKNSGATSGAKSSSGTKSNGTSVKPGASTATSSKYTGPRTTITFGVRSDTGEKQIAQVFKTGFEKLRPDIEIKIQNFGEYNQAMFNYIASNSMPDVVWTAGDAHSPYSSLGAYENLKPYFDKDKIDLNQYFSTSIDSTHFSNTDKGIWFAPRDYNKMVIIYNKDMFDGAGISYPKEGWSWAQFIDDCNKLRVKMDANSDLTRGLVADAYPLQGELAWNVMTYTMTKGYGANIFDSNKNLVFDSAQGKSALNEIKMMVDNKLAMNPQNQDGNLFARKKTAMAVIVRPSLAGCMNKGIKFDFVSFPKLQYPVVGAGCSGYAISAKTTATKKDLAWAFLKYIISEKGQNDFGATGYSVPVLKSLAQAQTGTWRNYPGKGYNNDAFISYPENDLYLNYADFVTPTKQKKVYDEMNNLYYGLMIPDYNNNGSLDALIAEVKTNVLLAMK